jgi:hypothetical protein
VAGLPIPFGPSSDAPKLNIVSLDSDTQGLVNNSVQNAGRSGDEFAADINNGVAQNAASLGQDQQHATQEDQRGGDNSPYMADALRGAYQAHSDQNVGRLIKSNQYKGEMAKADYMRQTAAVQAAQQNVRNQNYSMLTEAYNQNEMARAQFVNSLFQLGGTAVAMYGAEKRDNRRFGKPQMQKIQKLGGHGVGNEDYGSGGAGEPMPSYGSDGGME